MSLLSTAAAQEQRPQAPGAYERFIRESRDAVVGFYDRLGDRQLAWNRRFRYFREHLARFVRHFVPPGARVLDIGCGSGDVLEALAPALGVGVDCSPRMVDLARREHPRLTFAVGCAESLNEVDIPDGPYDYITLINVIGEMCDIRAALRQVHRFLTGVIQQPARCGHQDIDAAAQFFYLRIDLDATEDHRRLQR